MPGVLNPVQALRWQVDKISFFHGALPVLERQRAFALENHICLLRLVLARLEHNMGGFRNAQAPSVLTGPWGSPGERSGRLRRGTQDTTRVRYLARLQSSGREGWRDVRSSRACHRCRSLEA